MTGDEFLKRVVLWPALMLVLFALAFWGFGLVARPAAAQALGRCAPTGAVIKSLEHKFGERPVAWVALPDAVGQLWVNPGSFRRSWTIVRHKPGGFSCIEAAGKRAPLWMVEAAGQRT